MKKNELIDALHSIGDDMIEEVNQLRQKHANQKKRWIKYLAAAACLCIVLAGLFQIGGKETDFPSRVTVYAKEMHADNKNVFWSPADKPDAEVQIVIEVLKDDKVIGNQKVIIEENDKAAFVAKIANGE